MKSISLHQAKKIAPARPAGYIDDILILGKLEGDLVTLSDADYDFLIQKYRNNNPERPVEKPVENLLINEVEESSDYYNKSLDSTNLKWEDDDDDEVIDRSID
jgi:hypothetical protein